MHTRCRNKNIPGARYYSCRGIAVCDEWKTFVPFQEWAHANGYADGLTIERKNNDLGYSPNNCTWASKAEQNLNRRFVLKNSNGEPWSAIAKKNGIAVTLMHGRLHEGWPIEQAATLPRGSRLKSS